MKVFEFQDAEYRYGIAAPTLEEAKEHLFEFVGEVKIIKEVEIPESEWDIPNIDIWEDNDHENEPFKESINTIIAGETEPIMVYSTDPFTFD